MVGRALKKSCLLQETVFVAIIFNIMLADGSVSRTVVDESQVPRWRGAVDTEEGGVVAGVAK